MARESIHIIRIFHTLSKNTTGILENSWIPYTAEHIYIYMTKTYKFYIFCVHLIMNSFILRFRTHSTSQTQWKNSSVTNP